MISIINEIEIRILIYLAQFKFLTSSQILFLGGVGKYKNHLNSLIKHLRQARFIDSLQFCIEGRKQEPFHCLTQKGANTLIHELSYHSETINFPKCKSYFSHHYLHRKHTLFFHIAFQKWVDSNHYETIFLDRDFDHTSGNKAGKSEPKNKIILSEEFFIVPDIAGMFEAQENLILFLAEISNGKDTKAIMQKILNHFKVLEKGLAKQKYQHERGHFIAWVFSHVGLKKAVMRRMQEDSYFVGKEWAVLFKTTAELEQDFFTGWQQFTGKQVNFLPF